MEEDISKSTDGRGIQLFLGTAYLKPAEGQTLKEALGLYMQPFIEHPDDYSDLGLLDAASSFQTITGIFVVRGGQVAPYLKDFYNGTGPKEVTRIITSRGFRDSEGRVLPRDDLRKFYHRWFFGKAVEKPVTDVRTLLEEDESLYGIVNYAVQLGPEIRIRLTSDNGEFIKLTDKLVRNGVTGNYVEYLPPILYRDLDEELATLKV